MNRDGGFFPGAKVGENRLSAECYNKLRTELEECGVIQDGQMVSGYEFDSPTQAANVILGYRISGNVAWKDKSGKTLKELQEGKSSEDI